MGSMTMAFAELDECISIYSFFYFSDFMLSIAVIWISYPKLSYVCHNYAMPICAPISAKNS